MEAGAAGAHNVKCSYPARVRIFWNQLGWALSKKKCDLVKWDVGIYKYIWYIHAFFESEVQFLTDFCGDKTHIRGDDPALPSSHTAKEVIIHCFLGPCFKPVQWNELSLKRKPWFLSSPLGSCLWSFLEMVSRVCLKNRSWLTVAKRREVKDYNLSQLCYWRLKWSCALCKLKR